MALALSRRAVECDYTTPPSAGDTCFSFASNWGLSVDTLQQLNPGISGPNLDTSQSYCVIGTHCPSNSPIMPGVAENCDAFYRVSSGDRCGTIAASHDYYICVHFSGATTTTQPTTPESIDEPSGPTPQMPRIITFEQVRRWNTQVDAACSNLWLGYYVCVGV
ncbi:hypothetical protein BDV06DRAFT_213139 [Aspergillus oleicola]